MNITKLEILQFRCFKQISFIFEKSIIVFVGANGSGKSSLIEALHYICHLRSFRTHRAVDLVHTSYHHFFIKIVIEQSHQIDRLQVGVHNHKKIVKFNDTVVTTYKEILDHYCVITLTEDDLALIKEGPDVRRMFIDQSIGLSDYTYLKKIKMCKKIVDQRNAFIKNRVMPWDEYLIWSKQLSDISQNIQQARKENLAVLSEKVNNLLIQYCPHEPIEISFEYQSMLPEQISPLFFKQIYTQEQSMGRSLFGAHLDDYKITFQQRSSRSFASRGQQKLIMVLLKIAQVQVLLAQKRPVIMLLDDFLTDFDQSRCQLLLDILLNLGIQIIFTSPIAQGVLENSLGNYPVQYIKLTD